MKTLTVTAVLAVSVTALTGCGRVGFGTKEESRSYRAPAGVTALKIAGDGGRVEITASDSPGITVTERLRWSNDGNRPTARHSTEGGTFTLTSTCAAQAIGIGACGISYRVRVPHGTPVQVDNRDGDIIASGLGGAVRLHTRNGSVIARDLRASSASLRSRDGSLHVSGTVTTADLSSHNGNVDAVGLTADRLTARSRDGRVKASGRATTATLDTRNGPIEAPGLTADRVTATASDGSITLWFANAPTSVRADTHNGSVRLRLPAGEGFAIETGAVNGAERIDPAIHRDSRSRHRISLRTRDGGITVEPN